VETELSVNGTQYTYTHLKTGESLRLMNRLGKVIGPAMRAFFSNSGDLSVQALGAAAVSELLQNLDDATLETAIKTFGKQCTYTDATGNYRLDLSWETHFLGRHLDLFQWLGKCAEAEWASFFAGLTKMLGGQAPAK
jgi:hypothetical protein